jgi:hypothetical protein
MPGGNNDMLFIDPRTGLVKGVKSNPCPTGRAGSSKSSSDDAEVGDAAAELGFEWKVCPCRCELAPGWRDIC